MAIVWERGTYRRLGGSVKGTPEGNREYMRRYMADYRRIRGREGKSAVTADARDAAYDPKRDGPARYRTAFSELLGEPPIGRSALDQHPLQMGGGAGGYGGKGGTLDSKGDVTPADRRTCAAAKD